MTGNSQGKGTPLSERLGIFLKSYGVLREIARVINFSYDGLLSYKTGKAIPTPEFWSKLKAAYPEVDIGYIITGIKGFKEEDVIIPTRTIPVIGSINATNLRLGFADEDVLEWIPTLYKKDKNLFAIKVHGDSMSPEVKEGDYVICSPEIPFINGKIYAVVNDDSEHTLKRVYKVNGGYQLIPANPEYEAVLVKESDMLKLVRVVQIISNR